MLKNKYKGPLTGLNVIDFGHYYAGPFVGMLLADQGANVIRIVRPGAPELPGPQYRVFNRNKKLLTLDLKSAEEKSQVLSLIERADVLIENFRPGVMKRLKLDYASLKERNPGLVYLSLPGFASTDKDRAHVQAWEGVISAAAGMYTENNPLRWHSGFPPVYTPMPQCSAHGGMHGAIASMAALLAREKHGTGTYIEVPLVAAGLSGFPISFVMDKGVLRVLAPKKAELTDDLKPFAFSSGDNETIQCEKLAGAKAATMAPLMSSYPCADGRRIFLWAPGPPKFTRRMLGALGLYKELLREGFVQNGVWNPGLDNNLDEHGMLNSERRQYLMQRVAETLLTKTAAEWSDILRNAQVAFGVVRTRSEWLSLEPLLRSGVFGKLDNGKSILTVPGRIVDVSGPGGQFPEPLQLEAEILDFHTARQLFERWGGVRKSTGRELAGSATALKKGELLSGLKILDLSNVMAGPTSTYTLAQYGAQVIRSDPSTHLHPGLIPAMLEIMQGKRSLLADLHTAPGREVLNKLVKWADVVVHNILDDTARRLGVAHEQLQAINPDVVSCQLSCFGGTYRGGWEMRPGFDPSATYESGLAAAYGTATDPYTLGHGAAADMMGGLSLAFSALLGLYQKRKTGHAGEGLASLVRACNYYQLPFMIAENGNCNNSDTHGQLAIGQSWHQRIYQCVDGWVYVETAEARANVLAKAIAPPHKLEGIFLERDCVYWLKKLENAGIACHRVNTITDVINEGVRQVGNEELDETIIGSFEVLRWENHPCGTPVILPAPTWVRIGEERSYKRLTPTARLGQHTTEILRELGYTEREIAELIRLEVVHEFLPALKSKNAYFLKS